MTKISKKQFTVYMIVVFVLSWILEVIASIFSNKGNQMVFFASMTLTMYMPFLAVLIAKIPLKGMGWIPHLKGKIRYLFFALWMPAILSSIGAGVFFMVFPDAFDSGFLVLRSSLEQAGTLEQVEAQGLTISMMVLVSAVSAVTYAPFLNMFAGLGEEVGWRGAMYPYLKEKLGVTMGRIVGGMIWGIWHGPVLVFAGYHYGKEYFGAPVLGLLIFCIFAASVGILLDYVYEQSGTIWLPALMHGAVNAFNIFEALTRPEYANMAFLGPVWGLFNAVPMLAVAVVICIRQRKKMSVL